MSEIKVGDRVRFTSEVDPAELKGTLGTVREVTPDRRWHPYGVAPDVGGGFYVFAANEIEKVEHKHPVGYRFRTPQGEFRGVVTGYTHDRYRTRPDGEAEEDVHSRWFVEDFCEPEQRQNTTENGSVAAELERQIRELRDELSRAESAAEAAENKLRTKEYELRGLKVEMEAERELREQTEWKRRALEAELKAEGLEARANRNAERADELEAKLAEMDGNERAEEFRKGHEAGWDAAKAEDAGILRAVAADLRSMADDATADADSLTRKGEPLGPLGLRKGQEVHSLKSGKECVARAWTGTMYECAGEHGTFYIKPENLEVL